MEILSIYAQALQYPYPGQAEALQAQPRALTDEPGLNAWRTFVQEIGARSLSEQEELFTRSLDLNPLAAPYIGYQMWGENYKRGEFMARLGQEMELYAIELEGELPDHLRPVLRYLAAAAAPLPELIEVLDPALAAMRTSLKKSEARNPYLHLLTAIEQACKHLSNLQPEAE